MYYCGAYAGRLAQRTRIYYRSLQSDATPPPVPRPRRVATIYHAARARVVRQTAGRRTLKSEPRAQK